ncbi:MAG: leucyl aminopeptidase [Myxococcota bacterium]|nr:leucyl aminopeptidase [Myxococcota bacterium]
MNILFSKDSYQSVTGNTVILLLAKDADRSTLPNNIQNALSLHDFKAKAGSLLFFPSFGSIAADRIMIVGSGDGSMYDLRIAVRAAGHKARASNITEAIINGYGFNDEQVHATISSFAAGNYRFDKYKEEGKRTSAISSLTLLLDRDPPSVEEAKHLLAGRTLCRDVVNAPAAEIYPESLAQVALSLQSEHISVMVWDEKKLKAEGMGGITAVGQGSSKPPRFIHLHYKPAGNPRKKIALAGKGVTFDSGGLSLKSSAGMQTMRCDMAGSGTVLGVFRALRDLQPDVEVHGLIGAAENMCGANSFKLGDILTAYNGKTIEIHNTDAEGRLVLADCLSYGSKLGVDAMVDLATLTGACVVALGNYYTALFTNVESLSEQLQTAAGNRGEGMWQLPLPDFYKPMLKAEWADIKNVGGRAAGSITAALFLSEFVTDTDWAHFDIAGSAFYDKGFQHFAPGATGSMVETLCDWICS